MNETVDLILHPIRMRIILALAGGEPATAQQLADILRDVPQATLYRHINRLAEAGIITIVAERPVRGTVEKVYALETSRSQIGQADLEQFSPQDHLRMFLSFIATLLDDYTRYLQHSPKIDLVADGVGYHKAPLNLSDEEFVEFITALNEVIKPFTGRPAGQGRKRRLFSTVIMPDAEAAPN